MVKKGLSRDKRGRAGFVFGAFGPGYKSVIRRPLRKIITYGVGAGLIWGAEKKYGRRYLRYAEVALTQLYNYLVNKRKEGKGSEK
ncbi:hypothetical protein QTP99_01135 [Caldanaerobacter subterraneus KAk]|uniref:hypothetical protein n=1 Tax=Caldanaerobacter subterraneus TaxID=911092 RepID=UPI0032BF9269